MTFVARCGWQFSIISAEAPFREADMTTLAPFRAVSTLILKSVDDDQRVIEGVASSAATDHAGDVLVPRGASYQLPMPLLMHPDRKAPIGEVRWAKVTDSQIAIKARIAKG
jgi:hypothetical protein